MSQITQKPRLVECRKCNEAGFPNEQITFINSGQKKADGRIKWNLLNEDFSMHIHKSPTEKFQQLEEKPPARPPIDNPPSKSLTQEEIGILKQFVALLKGVK